VLLGGSFFMTAELVNTGSDLQVGKRGQSVLLDEEQRKI
jgi:hypothetical protein